MSASSAPAARAAARSPPVHAATSTPRPTHATPASRTPASHQHVAARAPSARRRRSAPCEQPHVERREVGAPQQRGRRWPGARHVGERASRASAARCARPGARRQGAGSSCTGRPAACTSIDRRVGRDAARDQRRHARRPAQRVGLPPRAERAASAPACARAAGPGSVAHRESPHVDAARSVSVPGASRGSPGGVRPRTVERVGRPHRDVVARPRRSASLICSKNSSTPPRAGR